MLDNVPPHCQLPHWAQQTAKTLLRLLAVFWFQISFKLSAAFWQRGWDVEKSEGWRQLQEKKERDKANGYTHQQEEKKKQNNQPVDRWLTNKQEVEKRSRPFPLQVETEVHHSPGFKGHAPALQAGGWDPGQRKGEQKQKRRERRERQRSAKHHHALDRLG